jgi:hypothetical protein
VLGLILHCHFALCSHFHCIAYETEKIVTSVIGLRGLTNRVSFTAGHFLKRGCQPFPGMEVARAFLFVPTVIKVLMITKFCFIVRRLIG